MLHAELRLGDSVVTCGEPMGPWPAMPGVFSFYVEDGPAVDVTYARALDAGATAVEPPQDQPWGHRSGSLQDPGGNRWTVCAVVEEVSRDEVARRMAKMMQGV